MEINVEVSGDHIETVEVVDSLRENPGPVLAGEQSLIVTHGQEVLVPSTEVQIETQTIDGVTMHSNPILSIPVGPPSPGSGGLSTKRSYTQADLTVSANDLLKSASSPIFSATAIGSAMEIPRKKSRNYLDSHKTIEKKRRDRINACLERLKSMVPDCKQCGVKKLDKAEILEMTIDYIQSVQTNGVARSSSGLDINMGQREWANDLTTWVVNNKMLYNGGNALDQFCQALLLHLQNMGSGNALATATSMLLNQSNSSSEEDALLRQQTVSAQTAILQHLQQQGSPSKDFNPQQQQLQQAQLTQVQALLLLQQQQQLINQQQAQETDAQSQQTHIAQLQQLQQLQSLLLQHIANEASVTPGQDNKSPTDEQDSRPESQSENPSVELAQADELGEPVTTEETVYTSTLADSLGDNLLQVSVNSQSSQATSTNAGKMWSTAGEQRGALVMLGGGDSVDVDTPSKSQLTVQQEVDLLEP